MTRIGSNLVDTLNNVGFKAIGGLRFIHLDLRLQKTPQEKSKGVKSEDIGGQLR